VDEDGIAHYTIKRDERPVLPTTEGNLPPDGPASSVPQETGADPQEESQLSKLEDQINQERERIKNLITDGSPSESDIVTSPLLREISERLRRLQLDLEEQRGESPQ
jgi:hypothetical protein